MEPYLVLLRVEFTLLRTVASRTVRSYRTLSPLPVHAFRKKQPSAVCSLLHLSSAHAAQTLSGTLLYGARTFLPSTRIRLASKVYHDKAAIVWSTRRVFYPIITIAPIKDCYFIASACSYKVFFFT
jgi:hypothetical protein